MLDPLLVGHDRERRRGEYRVSSRCRRHALTSFFAAQEWSPYLRYGDHSWKRISDPLGRRDIGMLLAIHILKHDIDVFSVRGFVFAPVTFS